MKIPHRELEAFRRDPRGWVVRRQQSPPFQGMRLWNESALRKAVHWLHKGHTLEEAASKLTFYARKDPNLEGRHRVLERLYAYERWHRESGRITTHVHLSLPPWEASPLSVGGSVDRIDMLPTATQPVQVIFLGKHTGRWRDELRMPLTQYALATAFGWPVEEVAVGVQLIEGSDPSIHHYSSDGINAALAEFGQLRSGLADVVPGLAS